MILLAFVVLSAGCSGLIGSDSVDDSAPLDDIPEEADGIVHFQTGVLTDSTTESLMDGLAEMDAPEDVDDGLDEPDSWDEAIDEFEDETDIDIDDVHSLTVFVGDEELEGSEEYTGIIVQSDLNWEDFENAADEEVETDDIEEDSYNDVTVYIEDDEFSDIDSWIADFGDGTFALGPEPVIRDVIDTNQGDGPGIDDNLRDTYEGATEGYLTAAVTLTDEQADVVGDIAAEEGGINEMFIPEAEAVTMSYHTEDDRMNAEMDIVLQSTEEAESFTSFAEPIIDPPSVEDDPDPAELPFEWFVDSAEIDSTDERVSLAFRADPDELLTALDSLDEAPPFGGEFALQPGVAVTED